MSTVERLISSLAATLIGYRRLPTAYDRGTQTVVQDGRQQHFQKGRNQCVVFQRPNMELIRVRTAPRPQNTRIRSHSKRPKPRCLSGGLIRGYSTCTVDYVARSTEHGARSMGAEHTKKGTGKGREGKGGGKRMDGSRPVQQVLPYDQTPHHLPPYVKHALPVTERHKI